MLFSHAKISSFRAKTHLVFHWCLYNIYIRHLKRTLIGTDPLSFEEGMGDLVLKIEFFPDIELCKIFFRSIIRYERYFFGIGIFFLNVFPCKEFLFPPKLVCRNFFSEITHTPLPPSRVKWSAPYESVFAPTLVYA